MGLGEAVLGGPVFGVPALLVLVLVFFFQVLLWGCSMFGTFQVAFEMFDVDAFPVFFK